MWGTTPHSYRRTVIEFRRNNQVWTVDACMVGAIIIKAMAYQLVDRIHGNACMGGARRLAGSPSKTIESMDGPSPIHRRTYIMVCFAVASHESTVSMHACTRRTNS